MANTTRPLTNTEVKRSKPKAREYNLSDGMGLALRVKPNGAKLWLFNYTLPHTQKRTNISFGVYPELSLKEARAARYKARRLLLDKIDPQEHRKARQREQHEKSSETLLRAASLWFEVKCKSITPRYPSDIWRSLEKHIFPRLGHVPVNQLNAPIVIDVITAVTRQGKLDSAHRLCQRINEIMSYCISVGMLTDNSLSSIAKAFAPAKIQHMPTLAPEQLPDLMHALNAANMISTTRCLIEW